MGCNKPGSKCTGKRYGNAWVVGDVDPVTDEGGVCLLDTLTDEEIGDVLRRNEIYRRDLRGITTDPHVLSLLDRYTVDEPDRENEPNPWNPPTGYFYTVLKGRLSDL